MKRCCAMLCGFFVLFAALFILPVSAESAASKIDLYCTVNSDEFKSQNKFPLSNRKVFHNFRLLKT